MRTPLPFFDQEFIPSTIFAYGVYITKKATHSYYDLGVMLIRIC